MAQTPESVRACYEAVASEYAKQYANELAQKPMDQEMLQRFTGTVGRSGLLVDLGCGPGEIAAHLHSLGLEAIGIDVAGRQRPDGTR